MTLFLVCSLVLAGLVLTPAALLLRRQAHPTRGVREAAIALHRAQLRELDRDAALGLVEPGAQGGARLEIERRLLAADAGPDDAPPPNTGRAFLAATLAAIPVLAALLYAIGGHPRWPADPLGPRLAAEARADVRADAMIARLRAGLATLDPHSDEARAGRILLGNVEARRGRWNAASAAWRAALAAGFDPSLADEAAEAGILAHDGRVSDDAAALLRRALAAAPSDAPWRLSAEARLAEREHQSLGH